jgi:predicted metal-dependent hydrolase
MARKWASCSPSGRICFSRDLISAELDFRTYVIVHELLHLRYPNHGRVFRRLLSAFSGVFAR